ncbi:MAG: hypothetical protein VX730_06555 [Pseudomonadota bacterium]|nr:hypothetical protein [Pseudomonadota bacterium]
MLFSSLDAYALFPDLGVVGDHRMMTVVGFAQQDYYFDLFKVGGLQTLALTFALIGGLLILLIPKNHNLVTVGSYLLLIFILIVSPNPSTQSLFFYPLGDVPERWNCPVPSSDSGLSMEELCSRSGDVSASGHISDSLPDYTMGGTNTDGFGAFVPQLVTIHFFTAVERTLLEALWGNTRNATHPGDLVVGGKTNALIADATRNNPNIKYYENVYSQLCSNHTELLSIGDFPAMGLNAAVDAAEDTFTFQDAIIANEIYYGSGLEGGVYPIRAATARLHPRDYTKSLSFPSGYNKGNNFAEGVVKSVDVDMAAMALFNYKLVRHRMPNSTLDFPHSSVRQSSSLGFRTHIFRDFAQSQDYNYSFWTATQSREPDAYRYTATTTTPSIPRPVDETSNRPSPTDWNTVHWRSDHLDMKTTSERPVEYEEFTADLAEYREALADINNPNHELAAAMSRYPVQLYIPYIGVQSTDNMGWLGSSAGSHRGLLPRTFNSSPDLVGTDTVTGSAPNNGIGNGANQMTPAVQSCLDFAALITSRRFFALEEIGVIPNSPGTSNPIDLRTVPSISELIAIVENDLNAITDVQHKVFANELAERARVVLQGKGCQMNAAGTDWVGGSSCSRTSPDDGDPEGKVAEFICETMGWSTGCAIHSSVQSGFNMVVNDFSKSMSSARSGNFASISASPGGATSHGGFNSYSAGVGDFIVKYGLMVASLVQGFVYGAYMKLMPVIIGYGIALILFMTPFVFLMGIAVPMQARSVLVAPIIAIAFLKTVSIALVVVDHAFVSLMYWVKAVNVSDRDLYEAMLIMAHLTASVSLFSLAGLLLFGLNDPGSFVKHLASMDKAGQVSFQEAMAYGAAPLAATKMATGLAKKGVGAVTGAGGAAVEKGGKLAGSHYMKDGRNMSEGMQETVSNMATSTGLMGAVHTAIGGKAFARGLAAQADKADAKEKFKDNLSDNFTVDGKTLSATAKAEKLADKQAAITEDAAIVRGRRREIAEAGTIDQVRAQSTALLDQQMRRYGDSANTKPNGTGPKGSHAVESGQKELESQAKKVAEALHGTAAAIDAAGEKARKAIAQSYERGTNNEDFVRDVDQVKGVGFSGMKESIAREVLGDDKVKSGRIETSKSGEKYYIADYQKVKSDKQKQAQDDLIKSKLETL